MKTIWEDPDKLLNLKQNFPELIIDSLLDCKIKDPKYISEMISFINLEFNDGNMAEMFKWSEEVLGIKSAATVCTPVLNMVSNKKIFVYSINKNRAGITQYWIKDGKRYILCYIFYGYAVRRGNPL